MQHYRIYVHGALNPPMSTQMARKSTEDCTSQNYLITYNTIATTRKWKTQTLKTELVQFSNLI